MASAYTPHTYQGRADQDAMLALVKARPADRFLDFPCLVDITELLGEVEIQANTCLWVDPEGRLAAFAILNTGQTYAALSFELASQASLPELGREALAWGEQAFRERYRGRAREITTSARADQTAWIGMLEQHGFQRLTEHYVELERALDQPIPASHLPPGFSLRATSGPEEDDAWVALHRAGFGTENMTLEHRRTMTSDPGYERSLDLVAVAPDGSLAAYVFGSFSAEENALSGRQLGYTDPVATHPAYRKLGLARALLLEALRRMQAYGLRAVRLGTLSTNLGMQSAAQAAGYRVIATRLRFEKQMILSGN
jgi:ribosomal protein S18 acetylase RimI-like enzyme